MGKFIRWLKGRLGMGWGEATVTCPQPDCGKQSTHRLKTRDGGQVVSCPACHHNMRIMVHQGEPQGTLIG